MHLLYFLMGSTVDVSEGKVNKITPLTHGTNSFDFLLITNIRYEINKVTLLFDNSHRRVMYGVERDDCQVIIAGSIVWRCARLLRNILCVYAIVNLGVWANRRPRPPRNKGSS